MSEKTEFHCDACGFDLTYTGNCEDWMLVLGNQSKLPWYRATGQRGGFVTSMAISPPVDRAQHFCGLPCLAKWLESKYPKAIEGYDKLQKHRQWLADQQRGGEPA